VSLDGLVTGIIAVLLMVAGVHRDSPIAFRLITWLLSPVYTVLMLGAYGATFGKMAAGIKVTHVDGSPITYGRALGRTARPTSRCSS